MSEKSVFIRFNPNEPAELDKIIRGSYDDFVRLERRNLLAASAITFISSFGKIYPNDVTLSGVGLPGIDASMLFTVLFISCLYFLTAYMVYAYPGFREAMNKWKVLKSEAMQISGNKHRPPIEADNILSNARYTLWLNFNYVLPVIVGAFALAVGAYEIAG